MKRKILIPIAILLVATLGFLAIITFKPSANRPTLPMWIAEVKPSQSITRDKVFASARRKTGEPEKTGLNESRSIRLSYDEVCKRLDADCPVKDGWTRSKTPNYVSWSFNGPTDHQSITAFQEGEYSHVYNTWIHELNWSEKLQRRIRGFFHTNNQ